MKKILVFIFLISSFSFSQNLLSKNGQNILPVEGDLSVGTDASSMIHFIGNIFSGGNNTIDVSFDDGTYVYVKKMLTDKSAVRYKLGANFNADTEDFSFGLGYGKEYRKGSTRLQGFYGFQGFVGMTYNDDFTTSMKPALFIGCEYFLIPKIAIGAEYSYGPTLSISDEIDFLLDGHTGSLRMNFYF